MPFRNPVTHLPANAITGQIVGSQIATGTITSTNIGAGQITTPLIAANAITAGLIAANAVTAGTVAAGAIDGMTITGALIRTAASGNRVEISATNVEYVKLYTGDPNEFDFGGVRSYVSPAYPNAARRAYTSITSPDLSGNQAGIDLGSAPANNSAANAIITLNAGTVNVNGALTVFQGMTVQGAGVVDGSLNIASTNTPSSGNQVFVMPQSYALWDDNVGSSDGATTRIWFDGPDHGELTIGPRASVAHFSRFYVRADAVYLGDGRIGTTASAANLLIQAADGKLFRSTSSLRYKADVQYLPEPDTRVLDLVPIRYRSLGAGDLGDDGHSREFLGLVAEDADALGLHELVTYNEDGEPDWLMYERVTPLLLPIVKALWERVRTLEAALPR